MDNKSTLKRAIAPAKVTIVVTATKVNENGTLLGWQIEKVSGPKTVKAVSHPASGGAIWVKVETLDGLTVLGDPSETPATPKKKLF